MKVPGLGKLKELTKRVRDADEVTVAAAADTIGFWVPYGGNLTAFALKKGFGKFRNRSADILDEAMPTVQPTPAQVEQLAPMIALHARMATEGEAEESLRLLAQVIAGQLEQGELSPTEFASYARVLSGMRQVEIFTLGVFYRSWQEAEKAQATRDEDAIELAANKTAAGRLIPEVVSDYSELKALMSGLTRTGLLITMPTFSGGDRYRPSSLFHRLSQLASLENASGKAPSDRADAAQPTPGEPTVD